MLPDLPAGPKVAFISPCGWGNLGDAAIIDSLIHGIRGRLPGAQIVGFTLNPEDTARRHGIEAHTCGAFSLPSYPVREPPPAGTRTAPAALAAPAPSGLATRLRETLQRLPIHGPLRTLLLAPFRVVREPAHLRVSLERLRHTAILVVAGGGQLDALWGGTLGHPYVLWRWARLARRVGARFAVLSVGTGSASAGSRFFWRGALRLASYRSYRDERSRELLGLDGLTHADPIVPDLAYAMPVQVIPAPGRQRMVVGISPMNYCHPQHWPQRDVDRYRNHVGSFGELAARLLKAGHEVVIFTTDTDTVATTDMVAAMGELPADLRTRLRVAQTPTLERLFEELGGMDLVVAARLHGVLLAHVANRPVLAVSHERKVRTLMEDMGHQRFCLEIAGFDPERGVSLLGELAAERAALIQDIAAKVEARRRRVLDQYDRVFGAPQV